MGEDVNVDIPPGSNPSPKKDYCIAIGTPNATNTNDNHVQEHWQFGKKKRCSAATPLIILKMAELLVMLVE